MSQWPHCNCSCFAHGGRLQMSASASERHAPEAYQLSVAEVKRRTTSAGSVSFYHRRRQHALNMAAAKRMLKPKFPKGYTLFTRPATKKPKVRSGCVCGMPGKCPKCMRCYLSASDVVLHKSDTGKGRDGTAHRVRKLKQLLKKSPSNHGFAHDALRGLCQTTLSV